MAERLIDITTTSTAAHLLNTSDIYSIFSVSTSEQGAVDTLLSKLQRAFNGAAQHELRYTEYREWIPGPGTNQLMLSAYPLASTTIEIYYQAPGSTALEAVTTGFIIDSEAGLLIATTGWRNSAAWGGDISLASMGARSAYPSLRVDYGAGYRPEGSTALEVDGELAGHMMANLTAWRESLGQTFSADAIEQVRTEDFDIRLNRGASASNRESATVGRLLPSTLEYLARKFCW